MTDEFQTMDHRADTADDVIRLAILFWSILSNDSPDPLDIQALRRVLHDTLQSTSVRAMYDGLTDRELVDLINGNAQRPRMLRTWKHALNTPRKLSPTDARQFADEFISALGRNVSQVLEDRNLAGTQITLRDAVGDIRITRNAGAHDGWSLHLTTRGSGQYECVRTRFRSKKGDLVLLSPDAPYDYRRADDSEIWDHAWIYFQPKGNLLRWTTWPELGPNIYHARTPEVDYPTIEGLFRSLLQMDPALGGAEAALFENIVEQILIRAQFLVPQQTAAFSETRVNDAKTFIQNNLNETFSVEDIARHVKLSRTRLSDLFKRSTGQTLMEWRDERRLAQAMQMLLHTDLSIAAIADEIGFGDPLYFSRRFRQALEVSPREYRRHQGQAR